jgi:hypothetical protein
MLNIEYSGFFFFSCLPSSYLSFLYMCASKKLTYITIYYNNKDRELGIRNCLLGQLTFLGKPIWAVSLFRGLPPSFLYALDSALHECHNVHVPIRIW